MPLFKVLAVVFPVFSIIAAGYLFARFRKIDLAPVIEILLYITIPALVISSLSQKAFFARDLVVITLAVGGVIGGTALMSFLYLRFTGQEGSRGFYLPAIFMNSGNMSFPLSYLAFGPEGLAVAVVYYIAVSLLVYTLGVYIAKGSGGLAEVFRLPLIYAAALGLSLNLAGMKLPSMVLATADLLGAATIPLMQISLGYKLFETRLTHIRDSLWATAIRIGGGVAIAWLIVWTFGMEGLEAKIVILSSAMPSAVITFIMSQRYGVQSDLVASVVATSTLASVVTTPLVLLLIM